MLSPKVSPTRSAASQRFSSIGRPGARYLGPGENVTVPHERLRALTGRRLPAVRMPLEAALPVLKLGYNTGWPLLPHRVEGARLIATETRVDHSATVDDLGLHGRSLTESMGDTVRWLVEAGHIPARAAGRCLEEKGPAVQLKWVTPGAGAERSELHELGLWSVCSRRGP